MVSLTQLLMTLSRWSRLEDLVQQGDKQGGIKHEQFWTLLHWTVSEKKV